MSAIAAYFVVFVQFSTLNNDLYRIQNTSRYGPSRYLPETQHIGSESILGTGARPLYLTAWLALVADLDVAASRCPLPVPRPVLGGPRGGVLLPVAATPTLARREVRLQPRLLALGGRDKFAIVRGSTREPHRRRRLLRFPSSRLRWGPRTLWMEALSCQPVTVTQATCLPPEPFGRPSRRSQGPICLPIWRQLVRRREMQQATGRQRRPPLPWSPSTLAAR